jgi:hypothetical protein
MDACCDGSVPNITHGITLWKMVLPDSPDLGLRVGGRGLEIEKSRGRDEAGAEAKGFATARLGTIELIDERVGQSAARFEGSVMPIWSSR